MSFSDTVEKTHRNLASSVEVTAREVNDAFTATHLYSYGNPEEQAAAVGCPERF